MGNSGSSCSAVALGVQPWVEPGESVVVVAAVVVGPDAAGPIETLEAVVDEPGEAVVVVVAFALVAFAVGDVDATAARPARVDVGPEATLA